MNDICIKRKCGCCSKEVSITLDTLDEVIYYGKKYYHSKCFTLMVNEKIASTRTAKKWLEVLSNMDKIKQESNEHLEPSFIKEGIFRLIGDNYNMTVVPKSIYERLDSIYKGEYKGLTTPIPPAHLLDMWKRRMPKLNAIHMQNQVKGKSFSSAQRIAYDLAILLNQYDSYLKWLEKQRIIEREEKAKELDTIVTNSLSMVAPQNQTTEDESEFNISSLVDDIFGDE